jgi:hypothetical protein
LHELIIVAESPVHQELPQPTSQVRLHAFQQLSNLSTQKLTLSQKSNVWIFNQIRELGDSDLFF